MRTARSLRAGEDFGAVVGADEGLAGVAFGDGWEGAVVGGGGGAGAVF